MKWQRDCVGNKRKELYGMLAAMRELEAVAMTGRQTDRQSIGQVKKHSGMYGRRVDTG